MITATLSAIFLAPGNMLIFAMMLMFCVGVRSIKLNLSQKLFCWFLGFSAIGCLLSTHPFDAVGGSTVRCEGLVFWIIVCRLAHLHWSVRECDENGFDSIGTMAVVISSIFLLLFLIGCPEPATPIMAGAFGAVLFATMIYYNPLMAVFPLGMALYGGCRTALFLILASIFTFALMVGVRMKYAIGFLAFCAILAASVGMFGHMSAIEKMRSLKLSGIGDGTRIHYIHETARIWKEFPIHKKMIGDGFDSIRFYLKNPTDKKYAAQFLADRTHNIFCDMLIQTGVIGLLLFSASLVMAFVIVFKNPTGWNKAAAMGLSAWIVFGLFNPQGAAAHAVAMICLFGIRSSHDEV